MRGKLTGEGDGWMTVDERKWRWSVVSDPEDPPSATRRTNYDR